MKATCSLCGEEIINGREVYAGEDVFYRSCVGETYYLQAGQSGRGAISKVVLSQASSYHQP
jgi:hypothetical protein